MTDIATGVNTALKVGAWGMIGGTSLTSAMFYKARQISLQTNSWTPLALAAIASPITMFYGGMSGALLKSLPLNNALEIMVKAPFIAVHLVMQQGPHVLVKGVQLPFNFAQWLFSK